MLAKLWSLSLSSLKKEVLEERRRNSSPRRAALKCSDYPERHQSLQPMAATVPLLGSGICMQLLVHKAVWQREKWCLFPLLCRLPHCGSYPSLYSWVSHPAERSLTASRGLCTEGAGELLLLSRSVLLCLSWERDVCGCSACCSQIKKDKGF